jgi:methylated-DNA-[protein]-cysteine S-methyltransferase
MASLGHTLFDTAIGVCGLAWGAHGITAVQLPEPDTDATRARLLKSAGDCPEVTDLPDAVRAAITGIQALPPRAGRRPEAGWVFSQWRCAHQAAHAGD